MGIPLHASSVSISIDTESESRGANRAESLNSVLIELLDRFNRREIPATWAFHDPAEALLVAHIVDLRLAHEIAIMDDRIAAPSQFSRPIC